MNKEVIVAALVGMTVTVGAASFVATDLIMHKALPQAGCCLLFEPCRRSFLSDPKLYLKDVLKCRYGNGVSLFWLLLSAPVAWHKHEELKKKK